METRANYILIGAFAIAGFLGILGFFLWFANIQLDRQFAYYDIDFKSVSGLSDASSVRFSGLPVGQVVDVRLSPNNDGRVRVRVEVGANTPVREDSIATIEAQGVTGVSFVGISAGTPEAPLLSEVSADDVPMINAGQSVLQSLTQDAPTILAEALEAVRELRNLIGGENQERVQRILENIERSSVSFSQALDDFSAVSGSVSVFASEIDRFNTTLNALTTDASGALSAVETTLTSIDGLTVDARRVLDEGSETLTQAQSAIRATERYINEDLGPATVTLNQSISEIELRFAALSESATGMVATYTEAGAVATQRLTEARETLEATNALIARMDDTLGSVDTAARRIDGLIADGAEPLIAELRVATIEATDAIELIGDAAETELPEIIEVIRATTLSASVVIDTVGADLSAASGRIDGLALSATEALDDARVTFSNANETLSAINAALETGDRALSAAESAFEGADRVINEDVAEITAGLRATLAELEAAIGNVANEIPAVTEELREASRSAESAFAQIEGAVSQSAPAISAFSATALPQFGRLAAETRTLIDNLDKLVEQIRRDPSRFFIVPGTPEFRR